MAVVEQVIIKVDIKADIDKDLASIESRIKALEKRMNALNKATGNAANGIDDIGRNTKRLGDNTDKASKRFKKFEKVLDSFGNGIKKLGKLIFSFLKTIGKISFIALAAEVAIFSAALLGVKAALVGGRALVQGYQYAMKGLSVAAASAATGLAIAAAAMRQYQEAQLIPLMGGGAAGKAAAKGLSRSYSAQTRGLYGSEALGAVSGSLAASGIKRGDAVATQLFNISGGDAKAAQSLAAAIASARQSGSTAELLSALSGARGYKADSIASGASLESIIATISSGGATAEAFNAVASDMASTFIGSIKTQFESIKSIFADVGEPLLSPFQQAFEQIARIIKDDLLGVSQVIREFATGSLAPSLVSFADAVSEFIRSNIVKHVSDIAGTADKLKMFFGKMGDWYTATKNWFKSYEDAANVVWEMVKAIFSSSEGGLFRGFSDMLVENREAFIEFGSKIGEVITAIKKAFMSGNSGFFKTLDRLSEAMSVVAESVVPAIADVMAAVSPLFDKLPEIIGMVADRLGPILVNIFEAFQPVVDRLPDVADGVLRVVEALEPLVIGLAKVVESILAALQLGGGAGNFVSGLGAMALYGGLGTAAGRRALLGKARSVGSGSFGDLRAAAAPGAGYGARDRLGLASMYIQDRSGISAYRAARAGGAGRFAASKAMRPGGAGGLMLGIGGAAAGIGGVSQIYNEGASFGAVTSAVGGGAALGFAVGGPVGAAVGAVVGGIASGIAAWSRDNRIKDNAKKLADDFLSGVTEAFEGGAIKGGFTDEEYASASQLLDLAKAARTAGTSFETTRGSVDRRTGVRSGSTTRRVLEGDTEEMKTFLQAAMDMGVGLGTEYAGKSVEELIHLDEFMEKGLDDFIERYDELIREDNLRRRELNNKLTSVASQMDITFDDLNGFLQEIGLQFTHASQLNADGIEALYALYNSPVIDLAQSFRPDFGGTAPYLDELNATTQAAFDTLQASVLSGDINSANIEAFIDAYSAGEVAAGGNAAMTGLSALAELERAQAAGAFGDTNLSGILQFDTARANIFSEMSQTFGVPVSVIEDAYNNGGVDNASRVLTGIGERRERARDVFYGTGSLANFSEEELASMTGDTAFQQKMVEALNAAGRSDLVAQYRSFGTLGAGATQGAGQGVIDYSGLLAAAAEQGLSTDIFRAAGAAGIDLADLQDPVVTGLETLTGVIEDLSMQVSINGVNVSERVPSGAAAGGVARQARIILEARLAGG